MLSSRVVAPDAELPGADPDANLRSGSAAGLVLILLQGTGLPFVTVECG